MTTRVITDVAVLEALPEGAVVRTRVTVREKTWKGTPPGMSNMLSEWDMVLDSREVLDEGPVTLLDDGREP